jgi:hypothetical protein
MDQEGHLEHRRRTRTPNWYGRDIHRIRKPICCKSTGAQWDTPQAGIGYSQGDSALWGQADIPPISTLGHLSLALSHFKSEGGKTFRILDTLQMGPEGEVSPSGHITHWNPWEDSHG